MAWQVFKETGTRTKEFVSITETSSFGISRAFLDAHGITNKHKVVILFNKDDNQLALHFTPEDVKIGFAVRTSKNPKHGANVVARSFFEIEKIDSKKYAGRYDSLKQVTLQELGVDKPGDAFIINLEEKRREKVARNVAASYDGSGDEPIDLNDIPF